MVFYGFYGIRFDAIFPNTCILVLTVYRKYHQPSLHAYRRHSSEATMARGCKLVRLVGCRLATIIQFAQPLCLRKHFDGVWNGLSSCATVWNQPSGFRSRPKYFAQRWTIDKRFGRLCQWLTSINGGKSYFVRVLNCTYLFLFF